LIYSNSDRRARLISTAPLHALPRFHVRPIPGLKVGSGL
jgi:hypothetical protein